MKEGVLKFCNKLSDQNSIHILISVQTHFPCKFFLENAKITFDTEGRIIFLKTILDRFIDPLCCRKMDNGYMIERHCLINTPLTLHLENLS